MMVVQRKTALVAEDHEVFRAALARILRRDCGFNSVVETASLDEALKSLEETPDVTFATFDLAMPGMNGAANLRNVRRIFPRLVVAVVSASDRREDILDAMTAGAHCYIPKTLNTGAITAAINMTLSGKIFVPWSVAELPASVETKTEIFADATAVAKLTARQLDVLRLIQAGRSNKEIARELGLTESTIKVHANAIYRLLGVRNRVGAASIRVE